MLKHILVAFLLFHIRVKTNGQTSPPQKGAIGPQRDAIQGQWCLCEGRDTVFLEFDRSHLYTSNHDTLLYRIHDDLIEIDQFIGGIQSRGFIRKLTSDSLLIEWTTGDSNTYRRVAPDGRKQPRVLR